MEADARRRGEPKARTAERLIEEGLRMDAFPGIVFRDGPTGRRAGLAAGPDVWEVIGAVKGSGLSGEAALAAAAEWSNLTATQVSLAVRYYGEYQDEIDDRIRLNEEEAERLRESMEKGRAALA